MNILISVYVILILCVMPFYYTEGFAHIGTDKSEFFNKVSVGMGMLLVPVLICCVIVWLVRSRKRSEETNGLQGIKALCAGVRLSVTDKFACVYGIALLLSYACSAYKEEALWGNRWWYMGLYPQLILLAIYFLVSRFWKCKKVFFYLVFPVSGIVFMLGILNRFGIFPIDMEVENVQFLSTIGNINWYCGYLVTVFFGGVSLFWQREKKEGKRYLLGQMLLVLYLAVGFATLVTQGSSSGIVTLFVMLLAFFCLSVEDAQRMLYFWQLVFIFSEVCLGLLCIRKIFPGKLTYIETTTELLTNSVLPIIMTVMSVLAYAVVLHFAEKGNYPVKQFRMVSRVVCFGALGAVILFIICVTANTLRPGCLGSLSEKSFFTFSPEWGSNRGATWSAGVRCFWEQNTLHKLVGVGPDCMWEFLTKDGSQGLLAMVQGRFGRAVLANAHNEWLTILVDTGIIGFIGYVGMIVSAIVRYVRRRGENKIAAAVGICLLAYTVNNMFSFQQAMNVSTMFVLLGMGEAFYEKRR